MKTNYIKTNGGYITIAEVMIIIAIVALLAAIAVPNFNKAKREKKEKAEAAKAEAAKAVDNRPTMVVDMRLTLPSGEKLVSASAHNGEAILLSRPFRYDDKVEVYTFRSVKFSTGKETDSYQIIEQR